TPEPRSAMGSSCHRPWRDYRLAEFGRGAPKLVAPPINLPGDDFAAPGNSQTDAPGAKASATIDRLCSPLHRRRRSGLDSISTPLIAPSLAPVQIIVLAPLLTETDHPSARKAAPNGGLRRHHRAILWFAFQSR